MFSFNLFQLAGFFLSVFIFVIQIAVIDGNVVKMAAKNANKNVNNIKVFEFFNFFLQLKN